MKLSIFDKRGRENSQLLSEIFECFPRKRFSKYIWNMFLEGTYSNLTFFSSTCSRRKWCLIGMCLVLECITGFFEILMALLLSHRMEMGGEHLIWISCNVYIIQIICVKHDPTATYYDFVVYKEIELCFLLKQDNKSTFYIF